MNITIIAVGKLSESYWRQAADEYAKRMSLFCKLEIKEIAEFKLPKNPSDADIVKGIQKEGEEILKMLPPRAAVVSLCVEGKGLSSEQLCEFIVDKGARGVSHIVFVIGGSHGLYDEVKRLSDLKLSLSSMTFPHQFARVMLLEQAYRAFTIDKGKKYHK